MSVFETCAVGLTVLAAVVVWLLVEVVNIHVEIKRFLLARERAKK